MRRKNSRGGWVLIKRTILRLMLAIDEWFLMWHRPWPMPNPENLDGPSLSWCLRCDQEWPCKRFIEIDRVMSLVEKELNRNA
jgi:hypothetical protein